MISNDNGVGIVAVNVPSRPKVIDEPHDDTVACDAMRQQNCKMYSSNSPSSQAAAAGTTSMTTAQPQRQCRRPNRVEFQRSCSEVCSKATKLVKQGK